MLTVFLLVWQTIVVRKHRDRAAIQYPHRMCLAASPAAMKFNCAQRAHQNTLETVPWYIPQGANSRYPKPTTGRIGSGWLGHQPYCIYFGYLTCDVEQRANIWTRVTFLPSFFALFFGSLYTTYQLLVDGV
ncbi:hypothetical protein K438DRAFT_1980983 [Mycena galopus ATCC 62051]|nr:hypothetical protein K438DRAFT_1980983 [Mycena galopus ATCC 62051]